MLKKSILAVALTITLAAATNAFAAAKHYLPAQDDVQSFGNNPPDQRWLDRAKGSID
jgi:hypothetical protein